MKHTLPKSFRHHIHWTGIFMTPASSELSSFPARECKLISPATTKHRVIHQKNTNTINDSNKKMPIPLGTPRSHCFWNRNLRITLLYPWAGLFFSPGTPSAYVISLFLFCLLFFTKNQYYHSLPVCPSIHSSVELALLQSISNSSFDSLPSFCRHFLSISVLCN